MQRDISPAPSPSDNTQVTVGFHGLFIGINRYHSDKIQHLASATRDAMALHALFSDNLGETGICLTDTEATGAAIRKCLGELRSLSTPNDLVVVTFAGHGTSTHQITAYDTELDDLETTAISLQELTDLVFAIPARLHLLVLDCCFSGAAGQRVVYPDLLLRTTPIGDPESDRALLSKLAGKGRIILAASAADQRALESRELGHGLLTYSLLQALLDSAQIAVADGRFDLHDLLKEVERQVREKASAVVGALQQPTVGIMAEGPVYWPVFSRGPRYNALFPPASSQPVTSDIHSLSGHGIPEAILTAWPNSLSLNQLQQDAVNEAGLLRGENVLVMAPTSAGKTLIGEMCAVHATQTGGRAVFLLPTKALVNEQYREFNQRYGPVGIRVVRATGDLGDQVPALLRGQFDIAILTYEKFSGLVLAYDHLLGSVTVVVIDEVHTIVDPARGPSLELLLTLVRTRRADGVRPQIVALSAVLGELNGLDTWLEARLLRRTDRPVPLDEGVLDGQGWYRYLDRDGVEQRERLLEGVGNAASAQSLLVPLVTKLVADGQQVLVVRSTRDGVRTTAQEFAKHMGLPAATRAQAELPAGDQNLTTDELRRCLDRGVAFHSAELDHEERRVIEEHFRAPNSQIRVIVSTTTLAQGVNLPAQTVVLPELSRLAGPAGSTWYRVAEYKNIAGRAGRLGLADRGRAIALADSPAGAENIWKRFVTGSLEGVRSAFLGQQPDVDTAVLHTVAITTARAEGHDVVADDVVRVLAQSLATHQARLSVEHHRDAFEPARIGHALEKLLSAQFVEETSGGRVRLTRLGAVVARGGMRFRSAWSLSRALRVVPPDQVSAVTLLAALQLTAELEELGVPLASRQHRADTVERVSFLAHYGVASVVLDALLAPDERAAAMRIARTVVLLLWINGKPTREIERYLAGGLAAKHVIGSVRTVAARAHDLIETVIGIAGVLHPAASLAAITRYLPAQLEIGIPEVFASLAVYGAGLGREHYLALAAARLTTLELLEQASDEDLRELLGNMRRVATLRKAIAALAAAENAPSLEDLLTLSP